MHSLSEDLAGFDELLERERPNLLLLGAMSVCMPGAVACAARAKELLGDDVCVVLGGRHVSETVYRQRGGIAHHRSSPLRLMAEGVIPEVFDLVIAGDGEGVIASVGETVAGLLDRGRPAADACLRAEEFADSPGQWIAGWYRDGQIHLVCGSSPLDRNQLPSPAEMFGVRTAFDVFDGRLTAHVFSDTGNGCAYDCEFCSERRSVTGRLIQLDSAADRLVRQLRAAEQVISADSPGRGASAFVEDSTLLGGSPAALRRLVGLLAENRLDVRFGAQFTVDQINGMDGTLSQLHDVGLDYLFIGVETLDPDALGGVNKDRRGRDGSWMCRTERAVARLTEVGVCCGAAILFGLGEKHQHRLRLLEQLAHWRNQYGSPGPISLNWAVQHPLKGDDGGTGYRYDEWAVPAGAWAAAFRDFGEASVIYPLAGCRPPLLNEVREVAAAHQDLFPARLEAHGVG